MTGTLVCDLLFESAGRRPDHPALISGARSVTYAALAAEVRALAVNLAEIGLAPQDRVGVFLDKCPEAATAVLAIAAAGCVFVPINGALPPGQVGHILRDCGVRCLITSGARAADLGPVLAECGDLQTIILAEAVVDSAQLGHAQIFDWLELTSRGAHSWVRPPVAETDIAGILYTSGSTGRPKGVVLTHLNFVLAARTVAEYLRYREDDRILNLPPYSFGFGLSQLFTSLFAGVTAVLHTFVGAPELMQAIVAHRVTGVSAVPTVITQLAASPWPAEADACVRFISVAGGRLPQASTQLLRSAHPHIDLYLMYGMTETLRSTYLAPEDVDGRPNSIGKPIPNADVRVLRPDGTPCAPNEPGELVQGGPLIARGYWNDAGRTMEVFRPRGDAEAGCDERCVWSGDIVTRDAEGFIYFIGRRDDMMKVRGYRVAPLEIEEALMASGQLAAAAVLLDPTMESDPDLVACVTPRQEGTIDTAAILARCRETLPAYLAPRRISVFDSLPTTPNGKLDRRALAAKFVEHVSAAAEAPPPADTPARDAGFLARWKEEAGRIVGARSGRAQSVRELYEWAFPGRAVTAKATFRSLGGDSLNYVAISIGLEELIGELPEAWEQAPLSALETKRRTHATSIKIRPDVLLRALAVLAIVVVHMGHEAVSGGSFFLLMLSGWGFARFTWDRDPRAIWASVGKLMIRIIIPTWVMLFFTFAYQGHIDWSVLFFFDNWIHPQAVHWWIPAWFLQVLFQIFLFMAAIGSVPRVARLGSDHCFLFGAMLVALGMAATVGELKLLPRTLLAFECLPQFYLWVFALGWMASAAATPAKKAATCVALAAGVGLAYALLGKTGAFVVDGRGGYWLAAGVPILLAAPALVAPRLLATSVNILAQASLFIYVFHWPIANLVQKMAGPGHNEVRFAVGFLCSLGIWFVWESSLRALRSMNLRWPAPTLSRPEASARGHQLAAH
jgi:acyl-CoA ligase (AMP-forming) (exosortase A-associated)